MHITLSFLHVSIRFLGDINELPTIGSISCEIASVLIGRTFALIPGPRWWNPGPFNLVWKSLGCVDYAFQTYHPPLTH
jgi:hypothetical protein